MTKTDYNTKISEIEKKVSDHNHDKYNTTPEFNNLPAGIFNARLARENLVTKTDFDTKLLERSKKITPNKTKHLLAENELRKLKKFDVAYFRGENYFGNDSKNYLISGTTSGILTNILGSPSNHTLKWRSNGVSKEVVKSPGSNKNILSPLLDGGKNRVKSNHIYTSNNGKHLHCL